MPEHNLFCQFAHLPAGDEAVVLLTTDEGARYTYADATAESARIANLLEDAGLRAGDRVTVQAEKSPQYLWLYLACLRAGLVFHPLNTAYRELELDYFLGDAQPTAVICDSSRLDAIQSLAGAAAVRVFLTLDADGSGTLAEGAAGKAAHHQPVPCEDSDLAALLYSSGTTGRPKGIMLSHGNLASNARTLVSYWGFTADDCLLHVLPVFHVHGLFVAIHCVMMAGASMRWLPKFEASEVASELRECSVMMGVPTYYTRLLADPVFGRSHCSGIRLFISGSAPLLADTFREFEQRTGHAILERYGMSETGMNSSNPLLGERRPGTVGPALPGVELRVVDENGEPLPADETGNLEVRGPNVFQGYWNMPEKTREEFSADGFFRTGDKASLSADAYVSIVGREKDMIICGGLNVYPREIEQFLDGLDTVVESAVVGAPHPDFGEAVVAVIVAQDGSTLDETEVIAACRSGLANFKVPKRVFLVEALPRNTMGKVQKNLLREQYAELFSQR